MSIVGHVVELGLVIGHEFRGGNATPASTNLEFLQACELNMFEGTKIAVVRADSAAYQATIFNWCEHTGNQNGAVKASIAAIPKALGKVPHGEIAEPHTSTRPTRPSG